MHLSVSGVSKTFGDGRHAKLVLDDITLSVDSGEFVALVGSSGSGKSTVMRLIAGLERPSTGVIAMDGKPVRGPGSDRGMVFQKYSLYPWMTAAQNVAFGMSLQGLPRALVRERTAYFLEVVGLQNDARRLPKELSGGMQQRVAIARALAADPKVVLLDEPFGALDLQIRETMQEFLYELWQRSGITALLITHDLEEALLLAQRVHIMAPSPGRIVRTVEADLDRSNLAHLRMSPPFLELREELVTSLRNLDAAAS
ncbi:ABC transporter ATP-binding protein [Synechococcus sp. Cruz-9H2]|uniref:ABC transporter ATP-binding protein n=1 Tax=unclassified Synechococcus TaxID=2626047 RepID=UPI0020CE015D|nr:MULTISPECIES: ABC transporter ATP-binding protein [unclassified Synechococcus]MCP9819924.1 ABC transporter ATP-binding protein [Synechococcus sp. Cruz-9H2]MCP9844230.1 ABC transporter ATP-binding protein [Synechococcus sp. Edmonson 11F2]MCP9856354.1 ABC transporter ATP-binding protein [Synechococcus sp. Cruz-9C9]MCP9863639.1 ABC transporter ATP-binding protein [Synechococcus sp. Cruz-7E5]MCP9870835.1 ABC transporter ATP-binding protein [Synechococcus sp. Cruz-7B9]